jgi:hypothetical protein
MKLNGQQLNYFNRGCQGEIISILKLDAFCRFLKRDGVNVYQPWIHPAKLLFA